MDNEIIRTYLWQEIIQLAFCPSRINLNFWVIKYFEYFNNFLELGQPQDRPTGDNPIRGLINLANMDLWLELELRDDHYFSLSYEHLKGIIWKHESDPGYFACPIDKLLYGNENNQRRIAIAEFQICDLEKVLDAAIFHPREHQHIESPINQHLIRIGGGIPNPLLYLFHLPYQFCPSKEKRRLEKVRLLELFTDAIKKEEVIIPQRLMASE
jgi:hypothetical protein